MLTALARWVTFDALKALFFGAVITVGLSMAVSIYRDIKTSGAAQARLQCAQAVADGNEQAAKEIDALNSKALQAANAERERTRFELEKRGQQIADLEGIISTMNDDPVCYPKSISRSLRK